MADSGSDGFEDKMAYFQAITGLTDPDLCSEILSAHGWNLEQAVSSITAPPQPPASASGTTSTELNHESSAAPAADQLDQDPARREPTASAGIAWRLVTLPFYVVSGGLGLVSGAVGLGFWIVGGVLSRSLGLLGLLPPRDDASASTSSPLVPPPTPSAAEATDFVATFERDYGASPRPNFVAEGFMDALQRSRREIRLLFVYLHSPDHPDTPGFCSSCLCSDMVAEFINANFVAWGGSIRGAEGFRMSNSLKASRFPFCAVVMASTNQRIALIQQVEGPKTPEEMILILQNVVEESNPSLSEARIQAEARMTNMRLREEQDAAYRAALEADQARERQLREEQERLEREAAEADRKQKEEEEARDRAAREAAEKEAAIARRRQEKAMLLGAEPDKGPDVTQVLVRFPTGQRRERRFNSSATIKSIYDFVDSLDCLMADKYSLVSNFPRVCYGPEKHNLTLKEAGLHPQASLFVEVESD